MVRRYSVRLYTHTDRGGKTLVGCKAVERIMSIDLQNKMDTGIVMWFVPSDSIKTQTLKKFKDLKD